MKIAVIGTGYVGLVTGACFADMGNHVVCVDNDAAKVAGLKAGQMPIFEPGLASIVVRNVAEARLSFTTALADALRDAEVAFIAVGTPPSEDGSADLRHVLGVARDLGQVLDHSLVVVDKSTVPVGTAEKVSAAIQAALLARRAGFSVQVVSNPEFLKEGAAIADFMKPDRVIIGSESAAAIEVMRRLYAPFMRNHDKLLVMGVRDAEMTKYAANAMLATKISFMNEIATLCDKLGVDVENVRHGIGSDPRIGYSFIYPGAGYGGSCFPKDVKAIVQMGGQQGVTMSVMQAVEARNEAQKRMLFAKLTQRFGTDLRGKTFCVWGLAFKPGTDDIREAPALVLIEAILAAGGRVQAYDPEAAANVAQVFGPAVKYGTLKLCPSPLAAVAQCNALLLVTEWNQFRRPDFAQLKALLAEPVIFDGRNQYDPKEVRAAGFEYAGMGR